MRTRPKKNPVHTCSCYFPNGTVKHYVTRPIKKLAITGYCKYCYRTHSQWWEMAEADYGRKGIILCGYCEYTSAREFIKERHG